MPTLIKIIINTDKLISKKERPRHCRCYRWDRAEATGEPITIDRDVVCDSCGVNYTDSPESGGFIFGSCVYCPRCESKHMKQIIQYGEQWYIKAVCPKDVSFADFVRDYRGLNATISIRKAR